MFNDKPKVLNISTKKLSETGINVMRPGKFGNPYIIPADGNRDEVLNKFEKYVLTRPGLIEAAKKELKGKNLICCCKPLRCHADTWLRIANEDELKESDHV